MNPLALPLAETWDLAAIFDSPAAVAAARASLLDRLPALAAGRGTLARSGSDLAEALERAGEAYRIWSALHCYASCASDGDLRVAEQRALRQSIELLGTRVSEALSYLRPEILALPRESSQRSSRRSRGSSPTRSSCATCCACGHTSSERLRSASSRRPAC